MARRTWHALPGNVRFVLREFPKVSFVLCMVAAVAGVFVGYAAFELLFRSGWFYGDGP